MTIIFSMPPRWGFIGCGVEFYKYFAPTGLKTFRL